MGVGITGVGIAGVGIAVCTRCFLIVLMLLSCAGLDVVYFLMRDVRQKLRVELEDWEGNKAYALYDNFEVGTRITQYTLVDVGNYSGTAGRYALKMWTQLIYYSSRATFLIMAVPGYAHAFFSPTFFTGFFYSDGPSECTG